MRTANHAKGSRVAGFFRLCLGIIVAVTLAMGGMALNTSPVQALTITPSNPILPPATVCEPWTGVQFTYGNVGCGTVMPIKRYIWGTVGGTGLPPGIKLDDNGLLSGCPEIGSDGNWTFRVRVWEIACCWPPSGGALCGPTPATTALLTLQVNPAHACDLTIDPTFYPVAWEGVPYSTTLTRTGGVGPFSGTATGLPAGLTLAPNTGILSGTPAPGTCGLYTVTGTCTDLGVCPSSACCQPVSRTFDLLVDCWANYLPMVTTYPATTTCGFEVQIGPGLAEGQTPVIIDGNLEATLAGNGSQSFTSDPCESHLVVVESILQGTDPKTRYACIGSNQKWVTETDSIALFDYAREVYIDTGSSPNNAPTPSGAGWYAINSDFSATSPLTVVSQSDKGVKLVFESYTLPGGGTDPSRDLAFTITRKGSVIANYKTYYLLQLKSDYPLVDESSYELQGSTASYNLALQAVPMLGFWGSLGGLLKPVNSSGTHIMNVPYTQKINWSEDWFWPIFWIVVTLLVIAAAVFYWLRRRRGSTGGAGKTGVLTQPPTDETTVVKTAKVDTAKKKSLPKAAPEKSVKSAPAVSAAPAAKKALPKAEPKEKPEKKPEEKEPASFCPKCGSPANPGAAFCKKCGNKLG